jgi:hypothetical protein
VSFELVDEVVRRINAALFWFVLMIVFIGFSPIVFGLAVVFRNSGLVRSCFAFLAFVYLTSFVSSAKSSQYCR